MSLIDWFIEIIEGEFIETDLVDLNMSEAEICERASYDSLATSYVQKSDNDNTPIGKQVL